MNLLLGDKVLDLLEAFIEIFDLFQNDCIKKNRLNMK